MSGLICLPSIPNLTPIRLSPNHKTTSRKSLNDSSANEEEAYGTRPIISRPLSIISSQENLEIYRRMEGRRLTPGPGTLKESPMIDGDVTSPCLSSGNNLGNLLQDMFATEMLYVEELSLLQSHMEPNSDIFNAVDRIRAMHDETPSTMDGIEAWFVKAAPHYSRYITLFRYSTEDSPQLIYLSKRPLIRLRYLAKAIKYSTEKLKNRSTAVLLSSLATQAKFKLETVQAAAVNAGGLSTSRFLFNKVKNFDTLESASGTFNPANIMFRGHFDMTLEHPLGKWPKLAVEAFLLGENGVERSLALCSLEYPGRALLFPVFRGGDLLFDDNTASNPLVMHCCACSSRKKVKLERVYSDDDEEALAEIRLWNNKLKRLFASESATTPMEGALEAANDTMKGADEEAQPKNTNEKGEKPTTANPMNQETKTKGLESVPEEPTNDNATAGPVSTSAKPPQRKPSTKRMSKRISKRASRAKLNHGLGIKLDQSSYNLSTFATEIDTFISSTLPDTTLDFQLRPPSMLLRPKSAREASESESDFETESESEDDNDGDEYTETESEGTDQEVHNHVEPSKLQPPTIELTAPSPDVQQGGFGVKPSQNPPSIPLPPVKNSTPSAPPATQAPVRTNTTPSSKPPPPPPRKSFKPSLKEADRSLETVPLPGGYSSSELKHGGSSTAAPLMNQLHFASPMFLDDSEDESDGKRGHGFMKKFSGGFKHLHWRWNKSHNKPKQGFRLIHTHTPASQTPRIEEEYEDLHEVDHEEPVLESETANESCTTVTETTVPVNEFGQSAAHSHYRPQPQSESYAYTQTHCKENSQESTGTAICIGSNNSTVESGSNFVSPISLRSLPKSVSTGSNESHSSKSTDLTPPESPIAAAKQMQAQQPQLESEPVVQQSQDRTSIFKGGATVSQWQNKRWVQLVPHDTQLDVAVSGEGGIVSGYYAQDGNLEMEMYLSPSNEVRKTTVLDVQILQTNHITMFRLKTMTDAEKFLEACQIAKRDVKDQPMLYAQAGKQVKAPSMASSHSSLGSVSSAFPDPITLPTPPPVPRLPTIYDSDHEGANSNNSSPVMQGCEELQLLLLNNLRCRWYSKQPAGWDQGVTSKFSVYSVPGSTMKKAVVRPMDGKNTLLFDQIMHTRCFQRVGKVGISILQDNDEGTVTNMLQLRGDKEARHVNELLTSQ